MLTQGTLDASRSGVLVAGDRDATSARPARRDIRVDGSVQRSVRASDPTRDPWAPDPARRRLSPREREIILLVGDGLKDIVIARRLGLSASTVATQVRRIRARLGLTDRTALIAWVAERRSSVYPEAGLRRGASDPLA